MTKNLASWKFEAIKSVMNDPALTPACLPLMIVALDFKNTWDKTPFLPLMTLMGRTGKARATVIEARRLLVKEGYWTPVGRNESGLDVYAISDPKRDAIRSLINERATRLREDDKLRKINQRGRAEIRRPDHDAASSEIELNGRAKTRPYGRAKIGPNYRRQYSVEGDASRHPPLSGEFINIQRHVAVNNASSNAPNVASDASHNLRYKIGDRLETQSLAACVITHIGNRPESRVPFARVRFEETGEIALVALHEKSGRATIVTRPDEPSWGIALETIQWRKRHATT
ncbi:hypothetical protein [Brucella pituitosa]|uniref:hypothetical protein n=1 Tax=Brucella pituitosa TaxID=571256 RepID=UPI000C2804D1|nr:hypothetical protein [Brucella pituitosa]PJO47190.1 hypothetical protein CWE02_19190 [Brucella pituitosa]